MSSRSDYIALGAQMVAANATDDELRNLIANNIEESGYDPLADAYAAPDGAHYAAEMLLRLLAAVGLGEAREGNR